jgi:predicted DNA-binding protein (MmcQ/YjbR family)
MNREEVFKYIKDKYNTNPAYLWEKYPFYAAFRHSNNKWFGIIMNVKKEKLGLNGKEEIDILNVKCPPELVGKLRLNKGITKAYHMNKEHWITILLDGSVNDKMIKDLIDWSYDLTTN